MAHNMQKVGAEIWIVESLYCGKQALRLRLLETPSTWQKLALCDAIFAISHAQMCVEGTLMAKETRLEDVGRQDTSLQTTTKEVTAPELASGSTADWLRYLSIVLGQTIFLEPISPSCNSVTRWALKEVADAIGLKLPLPVNMNANSNVKFISVEGGRALDRRFPAREPRPDDKIETPTGPATILSRLHRQIFGIEITAAEICAAIPLFFGPIPRELDHVLAIQTFEEGRHARMFMDIFLKRGGRFSSFPYPTEIWNNFKYATNVVEAVYIEQVLGEGYSIGGDFFLAAFYEERGDDEIASIYRYAAADELMHAAQGLQWFRQIAGANVKDLELRLKPLAGPVPGDEWFFPELRRRVGFTEEDIAYQRSISVRLTPPF